MIRYTSKGNKIIKTVFLNENRRFFVTSFSKCSKNDLTNLEINNKTGIATIYMNRKPINSFNTDFLLSLLDNIQRAETTGARGLIFTSSVENIFSGGLDIKELFEPDKDRLKSLLSAMQDAALKINTSPLPTVALINGHAMAGGCFMATCCEYRIMMPNFKIGVNEMALGIVPPVWVINLLLEIIPRRQAELALYQGKLFRTEEAYKIGLVDEVINDIDKCFATAERYIQKFKDINYEARAICKKRFRFEMFDDKMADLEKIVNDITQPNVQKCIGAYLDNLKGPIKK